MDEQYPAAHPQGAGRHGAAASQPGGPQAPDRNLAPALIEIQAEHFVRYLVRERYTMSGLPSSILAGLANELGVPLDPEELRQTPPRPHLGVWTSERKETPAHRARSNELGHALTPLEWGKLLNDDNRR